jgi:hypothetical protein
VLDGIDDGFGEFVLGWISDWKPSAVIVDYMKEPFTTPTSFFSNFLTSHRVDVNSTAELVCPSLLLLRISWSLTLFGLIANVAIKVSWLMSKAMLCKPFAEWSFDRFDLGFLRRLLRCWCL